MLGRGRPPLGEALAYTAKYPDGLCVFLTDGRVEIDNNSVERTTKPIVMRKNVLFTRHDEGVGNWATVASLIETCKLDAVVRVAYFTGTLNADVKGHEQSCIDQFLPSNYGQGIICPKPSVGPK